LADGAVTFNGTTQAVEFGAWSLPAGSGAFSIEAWVKASALPTGTGGADRKVIWAQGDSPGLYIAFDGTKAILGVTIQHGAASYYELPGTTALAVDTLYHVAATYDGTTVKLFLNGVEDATDNAPGMTTYANADSDHAIAKFKNTWTDERFFVGIIDDLKIYSSALSPAQIAANHADGIDGATDHATLIASLTPIAWFKLDEASGTTATDSGTGANDGTFVNSPTLSTRSLIDGGSTAPVGASQVVSATGAQTVPLTGLTEGTDYFGHLVHTDAAANDSNIVSSAQFTTNAPAAVEGVSFTLYQSDGATPAADLTNLVALWWDSATPTGAPAIEATNESTDGSGVYTMDVSVGALAVGQDGFLLLYDLDGADHRDSLVYAGKETVVDIS
jgi:hypothetical protein